VPVEDIDGLAEVKRNIKIPVVTGETLYTKSAFKNVFEKRACDLINPDICCTGILELREIATVAESFDVLVTPHNRSNTIGLAAGLQAAMCIPNFVIFEYVANSNPRVNEIVSLPYKVEDGYIKVPEVPGLGLDLDEEVLKKFPYKEPAYKQL
jgi:galactonate dehydratase